jgi:hypothetical protein
MRDSLFYYKSELYSGNFSSSYDRDVKKIEGSCEKGKLSGKYIEWYENGKQRIEGTYSDGKKTNDFKIWLENGNLKPSIPDVEQIKIDLIGKRAGNWTFESPSEYEEVKILKTNEIRELVEFAMGIKLISLNSGSRYYMDLLVTYKLNNDKYEIVNLSERHRNL